MDTEYTREEGESIQHEFKHILQDVHCLTDLTMEHIGKLRLVTKGPFAIEKFDVSMNEFVEWLDEVGDDIRGVEYDGQKRRLVVKERGGWMHAVAIPIVASFLGKVRDRLDAETQSSYVVTGSRSIFLDIEPDAYFFKEPDSSLGKFGTYEPIVVLEVGVAETTRDLFDNARTWLSGSDVTKLVILIDIHEHEPRKISNQEKWDLSEADFRQMDRRQLREHILQWHRARNIPLVGEHDISVYLWYSDEDHPRCILSKFPLSRDDKKSVDPVTIEDVPLRLQHLVSDGSRVGDGEPLFLPLRRLVEDLPMVLWYIERDRVSTHIRKKRQLSDGNF